MDDLERFVAAQEESWDRALGELRRGRKDSHWMWWIFPQLRVLGRSGTAKAYGIADLTGARGYLAHPVLGPRLAEAARAMLAHAGQPAETVLGPVDAMKLRSSMTLFAAVPGADMVFRDVLEVLYGGEPDPLTETALSGAVPRT